MQTLSKHSDRMHEVIRIQMFQLDRHLYGFNGFTTVQGLHTLHT